MPSGAQLTGRLGGTRTAQLAVQEQGHVQQEPTRHTARQLLLSNGTLRGRLHPSLHFRCCAVAAFLAWRGTQPACAHKGGGGAYEGEWVRLWRNEHMGGGARKPEMMARTQNKIYKIYWCACTPPPLYGSA